jgi:hypothetical protein
MADTSYLGREVEDAVRLIIGREFGVEFSKQKVRLLTGGQFCFDAVSRDGKIVVSIKSSRGMTRGGKRTTGATKSAIADLYYLKLVQARRRILVTTNRQFFELFSRDMRGRLAPGLEIKHVPLPVALESKVRSALAKASLEQRSRADKTRSKARLG